MDTSADVLLVTANVGSLFDNIGEIQNAWVEELYLTIHQYRPQFIALHFQEVGGKDYAFNMGNAENFFWLLETSEKLRDFDRTCIYVDSQFQEEEGFTALGSMYFIHKTLKNVYQYDFNVKDFKAVLGKNKYVGRLDTVTTVEKEKFPKIFWPNFKWSRKGYMRTRWIIHNQSLDLVNIHLFHDASNLIACDASPSIYSANRKKALRYVIDRLTDGRYKSLPFFLFGDFNFRLDTLSLVQHLCIKGESEVQTVKDSSNEVQKILCEEKDNDHQILLHIEEKLFHYLHQALFREDNGKALLKYDKEVTAFNDDFKEEDISFPPSYPYSEDCRKPTQYMNTRCPAWCDRILMSHSAHNLIHRGKHDKKLVVYNTVGTNVCMGDHKPVFLSFSLKTNSH